MSLAIIAGQGALPGHLWQARPDAVLCEMVGVPISAPEGAEILPYRIEHLGSLLEVLKARGISEICCAGAMARPPVDPAAIDAATLPLVPRIMAAIAEGGDDATLRAALALFAEAGFAIRAATQIRPDLLPSAGVLAGTIDAAQEADAARAAQVVAALSAADLGQGCVVHQDRVVAVEAAPGTDWMLASLAGGEAWGGLLFKAAKAGQERRIDLPAIGPETVRGAARAGLKAIVIAAGDVLVLERETTLALAEKAGISLWVRPS